LSQDGKRNSDSIASKLLSGGVPSDLDGLRFNAALNIWEFVPFGGGGGGFWVEIGRTTLAAPADIITVDGLPNRKYLMILVDDRNVAGSTDQRITFNNDASAIYDYRRSANFGAGTAFTNTTFIAIAGALASIKLSYTHVLNIADQIKVTFSNTVVADNTNRITTGRWRNVVDAISRIDITNGGGSSYDTGSEVVVLGSN